MLSAPYEFVLITDREYNVNAVKKETAREVTTKRTANVTIFPHSTKQNMSTFIKPNQKFTDFYKTPEGLLPSSQGPRPVYMQHFAAR
jgi:hypothetical protein